MNTLRLLTTLAIGLVLFGCGKPTVVETYDIVPLPNQISYADHSLLIKNGLNVQSHSPEAKPVLNVLKELVSTDAIPYFSFEESDQGTSLGLAYVNTMPDEHYKLVINQDMIRIEASSNAGWIYGFQTLLQMIPYRESFSALQLKCCEIEDGPRFNYRGMHFDVSRHFFTMEELRAFVDKMVNYKLNKLHLHLTDDQGWRIQIDKYPLLTEKGAWREHDKNDSLCIKRAIEDPTYTLPEDRYRVINGKKMYGGFYTKDEMRDFIEYCGRRNIEVIPEIDIPGHFKAAIDNYPYLSCTNEAGWGSHFSYPACLGKASTYQFIQDVLHEVSELFPSEYLHIGGDEVNKDEWKKCPKCQKAIRKNKLKDEHELQSFFNGQIEQILASNGKKLMGWDEIVEGGLTPTMTVMWWRNWAPHTIEHAAKNGNDIIVTPDFEYYFDFPYKATPTRKVYDFEPVPAGYTDEMKGNIAGVQANIWTERIPNVDRVYYMVLPRMLALAETGWTMKENKDFASFENRLNTHRNFFQQDDVFYHLPVIEGYEEHKVFTEKASFDIQIPSKDMKVYYTLDGTAPTPDSELYTGAIDIEQSCTVRFRAYHGRVFSKIYECTYDRQSYADPIEKDSKAGLMRQYYKGRFRNNKDVDLSKKADNESVVSNFGLQDYAGKDNYALVFNGYYKAPKDGVYTFFTSSDDGDQLFINDHLVVDNDGSHGPRERKGSVALKAGLHALQLVYRQIGGGAQQKVMVQVPGEEKREVEPTELFH